MSGAGALASTCWSGLVAGQPRHQGAERGAGEPGEVRQAVGHEGEHSLRCERVRRLDPVQGAGQLQLVLVAGGGRQPGRREERVDRRELDRDAIDRLGGGDEPPDVELHVRQVRPAMPGVVVRSARVGGEPHRGDGEVPQCLQARDGRRQAAAGHQQLAPGEVVCRLGHG